MGRIKLAILGCGAHSHGNHGTPMARYARAHPAELELAAACDLDIQRAQRFCKEFGFARAYDNVDRMLDAEKPDGCVCVMPVPLIAGLATSLLERGMPCVIEKPPGGSRAESRKLAETAARTGTPHMVSVNRRFNPYLRRAIRWAAEQGPVRAVRAAMVRGRRTEKEFIWGTGLHSVDAVRFIGGDVAGVEWTTCAPPGMSAAWYTIAFRFAGGAVGRLDILPTGGWDEESYELLGEGFRAVVETMTAGQQGLKCWRGNRCELDERAPGDEPDDVKIGPYGEIEEFVQALRAGRTPRPTLADVLPSVEICFDVAEKPCGSMKCE